MKGDFCSAGQPGDHWKKVQRGEGKRAQPPMMLLSVLMMPSRCLTLWEQMGLLCMSAFPACCIVYQSLPACLRFNVFVYWAQWQTVWCQILLYRRVVLALSAIIFIVSVSSFPLLPISRKRKRSACLDVHSGGFGRLITYTGGLNDTECHEIFKSFYETGVILPKMLLEGGSGWIGAICRH